MKIHLSIFVLLIFLVSSCSVNKQIARTATKTVIKEKTFENAHTGISIFDPLQNKFLYNYQSEKYFVPASNTKLVTCYAAMKHLEDSIVGMQYRVDRDGAITIVGTGDPTFLHPDFPNQRVYDFLKRFEKIRVVSTGFTDYLGSGWSWDDYPYDYMAPRSGMPVHGDFVRFDNSTSSLTVTPGYFKNKTQTTGNLLNGMAIDRPWSENQFSITPGRSKKRDVPFIPYDSTIISILKDTLHHSVEPAMDSINEQNYIYSQPLDSMLAIMMHRSDNFFAEQSLLMVSRKLTGQMDDRLIIKKLLETDLADLPQKPSWVDGSGLSHYNLFSPKDFVYLLNKMKNEFGMDRLKVILPTGGTGTLSSLYKKDAGYIFAKTGTINGVVTLSGYLITQKNRLLIFSVLVNNHRSASQEIRKGVERFLTEIRRKY